MPRIPPVATQRRGTRKREKKKRNSTRQDARCGGRCIPGSSLPSPGALGPEIESSVLPGFLSRSFFQVWRTRAGRRATPGRLQWQAPYSVDPLSPGSHLGVRRWRRSRPRNPDQTSPSRALSLSPQPQPHHPLSRAKHESVHGRISISPMLIARPRLST